MSQHPQRRGFQASRLHVTPPSSQGSPRRRPLIVFLGAPSHLLRIFEGTNQGFSDCGAREGVIG
jgi:hypothetical protein